MKGMLRKMDLTLIARKHGGHLEWNEGEYTFVPHFNNAGALARSVNEWREEMELAREEERAAKQMRRKGKGQTRNHERKIKAPRLTHERIVAKRVEVAQEVHERKEQKRLGMMLEALEQGRAGKRADSIAYRRLDRASRCEVLLNLGLIRPTRFALARTS